MGAQTESLSCGKNWAVVFWTDVVDRLLLLNLFSIVNAALVAAVIWMSMLP